MWDAAFDGVDDGATALVPVDVMVYDGATGDPVAEAEVTFALAPADGAVAGLVVESAVDHGAAGTPDPVWDAWRDGVYALRAPARDRVVATSDAFGLARVYLLVDAFPVEGDDFGSVEGTARLGEDEVGFGLMPRSLSWP